MKKYVLILVCFIGIVSAMSGQTTRYKIELGYQFFVPSPWNSIPGGDHQYTLRPYNGFSALGTADLIDVSPTGFSPTPVNIDQVIEYSNPITEFRFTVSSSFANCTPVPANGRVMFSGSECSSVNIGNSDCIQVVPLGQNRVVPIEDFAILNNGISPQFKLCEAKNITVVQGCDFKYAVVGYLNGETNPANKEVILPYAVHPGTININLNNISGLTTGDQIDIQIEYVPNPSTAPNTIDVSNKIPFDIFECAPQEDTLNPIDVACFEGNNGGFEIIFDRDIRPSETLDIVLLGEGSGSFDVTIPIVNNLTSLTNMTYSFQGTEGGTEIPAGNYQLEWTSSIPDGNGGSNVDGATSGIFNISQPSTAVAVSSSNITPVSCSSADDGAISINVVGGTGPYTFAWSNNNGYTSASQNISGLEADTYSLIITDINSCQTTTLTFDVGITPDSTPLLDTGTTITNQLNEAPLGQASITLGNISGGNGSYTYAWTRNPDNGFGTVTTRDLSSLTEGGVYSLVISSGTCVSQTYPFTINDIQPLNVNFSTIGEANCEGDTATIQAQGQGGTGGYSYTWSTGATTQSINVEPGTYTVTVSDGSGTTTNDSFTLDYVDSNNGSVITELLSVSVAGTTNVVCRGDNTGAIDLTISGGSGGYQVFWDGSFAASTEDRSGLVAGNYYFRVTDSNGCEVTNFLNQITITEPPVAFEVTATSTDATSNGGNEGTISLTLTNGGGGYNYVWTKDGSLFTPPSGSTDTEIIGLQAGAYQVVITDVIGCIATLAQVVTIDEPGPLELQDPQFTMTPVDCFGASTGSIIAQYNGTAPFTFVWRDSGNNIIKSGPEDFLDNQPAGFYTYTVDDATAAMALTSNPIEITQPVSLLSVGSTQTEVTCFGGNDGSITVTAAGGTTPYTYELNGGIPQASGTFTNLIANNYTIVVTDANGCSTPVNTILNPPLQITFDDVNAVTPVSTPGGSDGSISVTVQGGAQPYFYRWSGPAILTPINTADTTTIPNLSQGVYTLEVSNKPTFDIDGCYLTRQYTVTEQDAFSIQSFTGTDTCFNQSNGSLSATIEATGPVTFNWFDVNDPVTPVASETTNLRTLSTQNLGVGTYYLEIVDTNSTTVRSANNVEILELAEVSATVVPVATCLGSDTGSITFSNPIGSPSGSYSYSIDNGLNFQASPIFENLVEGSYTARVSIAENNNCDFILPGVTITNSPGIFWDEPNTLITRASGAGATDGTIAPAFTGGTAPLTYQWSANANNATTQNITGLAAGIYTVTVTDAASCSVIQSFEVTEVGPLTISNIVAVNASCKDEANGSITTTVTGEGTITYFWTLANGDPVPVSNGVNAPNITGILAGTYILTATDDNATVITAPILIDEPATMVTITNINTTDVACFGGNSGSLEIQAAGGTGPYTYSLNGGTFQPSPIFNDLTANSYSVVVEDSNGCEFAEPTPILLIEPQELNLIINEQRPVTAANATNGAIFITMEGGSGDFTYQWTGPNGFTSTEEDILNLASGDYNLTVTDLNFAINSDAGCRLISAPISITEPGQLLVNLNQTVLLECSGDDFAEITANVQGGVAPYSYEWFQTTNGNNTALPEDTNIIGDLVVGSYFVRVTDANSVVVDSNTIIVTAPSQIEITVDGIINVLCAGQPTGAISITVTGGTPPYQYFWSNSATVADISGLDAGDYTLDVEDSAGCIAQSGTITISAPDDAIQIANATVNNVSAYQALDGSISLEVSGGQTPYTYNWTKLSDSTIVGNTGTISNLAADSYSVSVSDANGCTITETYEVTQPDIIDETIVQPSCSGSSDGSISVLVNQGNGVFTYLWSTGDTGNNITNLGAGNYTVTVTGLANGPVTRTYLLEDPIPLEVDLGTDRVLCTDQTLELDATVDDATATYSWTSDNGFTSSNPMVELSETGNYVVTVQSQTGCTTQGTIFIDISTDEIDAEFAMSSQAFVGETIVAVDISYPLPEGIEWLVPIGAEVITQNSDAVEFSFAEAGEYEITIITTRGECIAQKTKKILVVAKDGLIDEEESKNGQKVVEDFMVYPNPTNGKFTADINLTERGDISIKVFSFANNALMASQKERGEISYSIPFDISGMPSGVYAVLLETSFGTSLRKVIVR